MAARTPSPEGSPEVDFGAFRRPVSRAGTARPPTGPSLVRPAGATSAAASAYFPTASIVPKSEQSEQEILGPQRKMRQGAPRLGGLGLGGIQPASPSPNKKRSAAAHSAVANGGTAPLKTKSPKPPSSKPPTPPLKDIDGATGRPFLSPEMQKPTVREGAFVLDRQSQPVVSAAPPPTQDITPPDSPSPQTSPAFMHGSEGSPVGSPDLNGDRLMRDDDENQAGKNDGGMFAMIQQVLSKPEGKQSQPTEELLAQRAAVSPRIEAHESDSDDSGFLTPEDDEEDAPTPVERTAPDHAPLSPDELPSTPPPQPAAITFSEPSPKPSVDSGERDPAYVAPNTAPMSDSEESAYDPATPPQPATSTMTATTESSRPVEPSSTLSPHHAMARSDSTHSAASSLSNSVSRTRGPPPPRPDRTRRPPSANGVSPRIAQTELPLPSQADEVTSAAPVESPTEQILPSNVSSSTASVNSEALFAFPPPPQETPTPRDDLVVHEAPSASASAPAAAVEELPAPSTDATSNPTSATAAYEGLGLRLPSSIRPRRSRGTSSTGSQAAILEKEKEKEKEKELAPPVAALPAKQEERSAPIPNPYAAAAQAAQSQASAPRVTPSPATQTTTTSSVSQAVSPRSDTTKSAPEPISPIATVPEKSSPAVSCATSSVDTSSTTSASPVDEDDNEDDVEDAQPTTAQTPAARRGSQSSDAGVADIGVAAVGAIVSGGMAVGYTAWRGLSAAASMGWGWGGSKAAPAPPAATEENDDGDDDDDDVRTIGKADAGEESDRDMALPGSFASSNGARATEVNVDSDEEDDNEGSMKARAADERQSEVIETEWGEVAFPAPKGFLEAFKEAMAELGPEDLAADAQAELEAQEAAYASAMQLHAENASPPSSPQAPQKTLPFPGRPSSLRSNSSSKKPLTPHQAKKAARKLRKHGAGAIPEEDEEQSDNDPDDYEELMEMMSPMLDSNRSDKMSAYRFSPPPGLSPQLGGDGFDRPPIGRVVSSSTSSMVSSRAPPSVSSQLRANLKPETTTSRNFFGFKKSSSSSRRGSTDSSASPPPSIGSSRRPMSLDSRTSLESDQQSNKTKGSSSIFGFGSRPKSDMMSIESTITDTTYVSYSSGRAARRKSASLSSSSDATSPSSSPAPLPQHSLHGRPRRSSLRKESRYDREVTPVTPEGKKIYTVRFANANRGIGLRSVAEDEATRAGGDTHHMRWVGVGRGDRYGNLIIKSDAESEQLYAEQVGQIKRSWRFGKQGSSKDWTTVRID